MRRRARKVHSRFPVSPHRPHAYHYGDTSLEACMQDSTPLCERRERPHGGGSQPSDDSVCTLLDRDQHTRTLARTTSPMSHPAIAGLATHSSLQPSPQLASTITHRHTFLLSPSLSSPSRPLHVRVRSALHDGPHASLRMYSSCCSLC